MTADIFRFMTIAYPKKLNLIDKRKAKKTNE